MPDGSFPITPSPANAGGNGQNQPGCRSRHPEGTGGSVTTPSRLGARRLLGGTRLAVEALTRRWALCDHAAVLLALQALLADTISPRAGVGRMILAALVGLRRGELSPSQVRPLLELGDRRRPDVELAQLVLVVALAGDRLAALELAGIAVRVLRLHFALTQARIDEDERDDEAGARVLLEALRGGDDQ